MFNFQRIEIVIKVGLSSKFSLLFTPPSVSHKKRTEAYKKGVRFNTIETDTFFVDKAL